MFDPTDPEIYQTQFPTEYWSAITCGPYKEDASSNTPFPRSIDYTIRSFVESDHARDSVTCHSRNGFIFLLDSATIFAHSKKKVSYETSSFGSELTVMKSYCEHLRGLSCKLRMFGVPFEHLAHVFGDNQSILFNSSKPHSVLKKKSSSIMYHFVREGVAKNEWQTTYLNTHLSPS